jgi:hypothetical protein
LGLKYLLYHMLFSRLKYGDYSNVYVKYSTLKNVRYCKHLCRIDRPSKFVISDYDICVLTRVVVTSTYLYFEEICDIL